MARPFINFNRTPQENVAAVQGSKWLTLMVLSLDPEARNGPVRFDFLLLDSEAPVVGTLTLMLAEAAAS